MYNQNNVKFKVKIISNVGKQTLRNIHSLYTN